MKRRPLGDMLAEVAEGAALGVCGTPVTVRQVALTLPVEIALELRGGEWLVLGDVPRLVTRTAFDTTPSRLDVTWVAGDRE
jgi:hypothetical protein